LEATKAEATRELRAGRNPIAVIVRNNEGIGGLGLPSLDQQTEGTSLRLESFGNPAGIEARRWETACDDTRWETVMIDAGPGSPQTGALLTRYRLNFELQPPRPGVWVPWRLRLNATGNGFLYLNGHPAWPLLAGGSPARLLPAGMLAQLWPGPDQPPGVEPASS